jgi:polar amino acid transport system substrate-binding protein
MSGRCVLAARFLVAAAVALLALWMPAAQAGPTAPVAQRVAGHYPSPESSDLLDEVLAAGILVVATDLNYPPQSYVDPISGKLVGFDVDVAKQVAARLGVDIEFVTPSWDVVISGNWDGHWDVSIGSMTPTDQRALVLWFSDPYYYSISAFAVHGDSAMTEVGELAGDTVGTRSYGPEAEYLSGNLSTLPYGGVVAYDPPPGIQVVSYPSEGEAIQALAQGTGVVLDGALLPVQPLLAAIDEGTPVRLLGDPAFYEPMVFALDQARGPSSRMLEALNAYLAAMRADGTLAGLSMAWYGFDHSGTGLWNHVFLPLILRQE